MPKHYLILVVAVLAETVGTAALQASNQFSRLIPSMIVVIAYGLSFYCLSFTLKYMPVGIVYALWSGMGIVFIAVIGWLAFNQRLDIPAIIGIGLILLGIIIIQLFSSTAGH